jgi:hypothetical protein
MEGRESGHMDDVARIEAVGGPFDGGDVKDLRRILQWIGPRGGAYSRPAPGRTLYLRGQGVLQHVDQDIATSAMIILAEPEKARRGYTAPQGLSFGEYIGALEVLASVARED